MSETSEPQAPRPRVVVRHRRPARVPLPPLLSTESLLTKIRPEKTTGHITALAPPSTPGQAHAANFLQSTPLPYQLYFPVCAIAKPLNPAHMHIWQETYNYEHKNQSIRWTFKRLLMFRSPIATANETDPGEMVPVSEIAEQNKIMFYDACSRRLYIMHAQTATNIFRMALEHQDHMFPTPHAPRNPYTNQPFGLGQLITIYKQLIARYERLPLSLTMFRVAGFDMNRYERHYGAHLRWCAIGGALRDRDMYNEMICTTLETMYRETFQSSYAFLIDEFPRLEGETREILHALAREYMELSMARVVRNPQRPTIEIILIVFRIEAMKRLIEPRLASQSRTISSLLSRTRILLGTQPVAPLVMTPVAPIVPPSTRLRSLLESLLLPDDEGEDVSGDVIAVRTLPEVPEVPEVHEVHEVLDSDASEEPDSDEEPRRIPRRRRYA